MTSRIVVLLVAASTLAACASEDLCGGAPGACIGIRITDGPEVDQLRVQLNGPTHVEGATPSMPGEGRRPPITTALYLPDGIAGTAELTVVGFRAGAPVGRASRVLTVAAGQRQTVELALVRPNPNDDLGLSGDLGAVADLATPSDLGALDLSGPDLAGLAPRYIFLLSARAGLLGTIDALDAACTSEGIALGGNRLFKAVINFPPSNPPRTRITLGQNRAIVLPSGAPVATDATFFSTTHLGPINQLANGSTNVTPCVWSHFNANGDGIVSMVNCTGWTDNTSMSSGSVGDPTTTQIQWTFSGTISCNVSCHVYCIEQ